MRKLILLMSLIFATVAVGQVTTTTDVGRDKVAHPDHKHTSGSALHTKVRDAWTKMSDDIGGRFRPFTAIANATLSTVDHNLGFVLADISVQIYSGTHPTLTKVCEVAGSTDTCTALNWIIAAGGTPNTEIDVTTPPTGGPHTFAVVIGNGGGGVADLQGAYDGGNDITIATGSPVILNNATGNTENLQINNTVNNSLPALNINSSASSEAAVWIDPGSPGKLIRAEGGTSGFMNIKTPSAITNWDFTLPPDNGDAGEVLQTDGNGVATWEPDAGVTNLQEAFDGGETITIADGDNQTLLITNNDVTNDPVSMNIVNNSSQGVSLRIDNTGIAGAGIFVSHGTTSSTNGIDSRANAGAGGVAAASFFSSSNDSAAYTSAIHSTGGSPGLEVASIGGAAINFPNNFSDPQVIQSKDDPGAIKTVDVHLETGDNSGGAFDTGSLLLKTGTAGSGTGDSGAITLETGTSAGGSRGDIFLKDGSEGTPGNVWTEGATAGSGSWSAPPVVTLQSAYDGGNTITVASGTPVQITSALSRGLDITHSSGGDPGILMSLSGGTAGTHGLNIAAASGYNGKGIVATFPATSTQPVIDVTHPGPSAVGIISNSELTAFKGTSDRNTAATMELQNTLEGGPVLGLISTSAGTVSVTTNEFTVNWEWELPPNDGNSGEFLRTNGSGVTTWASVPSPDLQDVFDVDPNIVIADTDNRQLTLTNNDVTNNLEALKVVQNNVTNNVALFDTTGANSRGVRIRHGVTGANVNPALDVTTTGSGIAPVALFTQNNPSGGHAVKIESLSTANPVLIVDGAGGTNIELAGTVGAGQTIKGEEDLASDAIDAPDLKITASDKANVGASGNGGDIVLSGGSAPGAGSPGLVTIDSSTRFLDVNTRLDVTAAPGGLSVINFQNSSGASDVLEIDQNGTGIALNIDNVGNGNSIDVLHNGAFGKGAYIQSGAGSQALDIFHSGNSAAATVEIEQTSTTSAGPVVKATSKNIGPLLDLEKQAGGTASGAVIQAQNSELTNASPVLDLDTNGTGRVVDITSTSPTGTLALLHIKSANSAGPAAGNAHIGLEAGDASGTVGIEVPVSGVTSYSIQLPASQGGSSTTLQNDGTGVLTWVAAGGANTTLSNLTSPTAINQNLIPGALRDLGTTVNEWGNIYAQDVHLGTTNRLRLSGTITSTPSGESVYGILRTGDFSNADAIGIITDTGSTATGGIYIETGPAFNTGTGATGDIQLLTGSKAAGGTGPSGDVNIQTGPTVDGQSGDIKLEIGAETGTGSQGDIIFTNGTASVVDQVWKATGTGGEGYWGDLPSNVRSVVTASVAGGTATATVASGTTTVIDYNKKDIDTSSAVTTGASWKFEPPRDGIYEITANVLYTASTAWDLPNERALLYISKNATLIKRGSTSWQKTTNDGAVQIYVEVSTILDLVTTDDIDLRAWQNSGGTQGVDTVFNSSEITIKELGDNVLKN